MPTFKIIRMSDEKYYYQFITDRGLNIISSDGYVKKSDCIIATDQLKLFITNDESINIEQMTNGYYRFTLKGSDRSLIGYSMPLRTRRHCNLWISFLREFAPETSIIEVN